jgi:hypothetical protein
MRFLAHTEARMHEAYVTAGRNVLAEIQRRILQHIINEGAVVTYKKLLLTFCDDLAKDELEQCLAFLLATDQIKKSAGGYVALVDKPADAFSYL